MHRCRPACSFSRTGKHHPRLRQVDGTLHQKTNRRPLSPHQEPWAKGHAHSRMTPLGAASRPFAALLPKSPSPLHGRDSLSSKHCSLGPTTWHLIPWQSTLGPLGPPPRPLSQQPPAPNPPPQHAAVPRPVPPSPPTRVSQQQSRAPLRTTLQPPRSPHKSTLVLARTHEHGHTHRPASSGQACTAHSLCCTSPGIFCASMFGSGQNRLSKPEALLLWQTILAGTKNIETQHTHT